jgi:hypothetical protein
VEVKQMKETQKDFEAGNNDSSPRILPTFRGYTIDVSLREFRKVDCGNGIEFIPFNSQQGLALLQALEDVVGIAYNPLTRRLESIR